MTQLYVAWQDAASRRWFPIGSLAHDGNAYWFYYTQGVLEAEKQYNFQPLPSFPVLNEVYESHQLFPLFSNRVVSSNRPDYQEYLRWLGLSSDEHEPLVLLSMTGGEKATDNLQVFPRPVENQMGNYEIKFFAHGIRHIPGANEKTQALHSGDKLIIDPEPENEFDSLALRLLSDSSCVGYVPRYLVGDIHKLRDTSKLVVCVDRVNLAPAPTQFRLLCKLTAPWPRDFKPFSDHDFEPLNQKNQIAYLTLLGSQRKRA